MLKYLKTLLAPVLVAVLVAGGANAAFWQWSKTSATNATADPSINWSEGMSPSSVNYSARAMMARAAEYRDDISGLLVTGGTSTAFTVSTNQGLNSTPNDGQLIAFTMHATNGAASTLAADGGTAFPLQTAEGTAVSAATLILGTPYSVKFSTSASAWILRDYYGQPFAVPLGVVLPYFGSSAPNSNFVLPYGQCISRTTFAAFFAMVGTTFGTCDGVNNFGVPDMRGRVTAGIDNMGGSAASRLTSTYFGADATVLGNTGGSESQTLTTAQIPAHSHGINDPGHTHTLPVLAQGALGGVGSLAQAGGGSHVTNSGTTGITIQNAGGGGAHANVQPTMVLNYILRVL